MTQKVFRTIIWACCIVFVAAHLTKGDTLRVIGAGLRIGENFPIGSLRDTWKDFSSAGVSFEVPTVSDHLTLAFTIDGGTLRSGSGQLALGSVSTALQLRGHIPVGLDHWSVVPAFGIANMLLLGDGTFSLSRPFAGESENEFGITASVAPRVQIRRWYAMIPVGGQVIFSEPEQFRIFSCSFETGVWF